LVKRLAVYAFDARQFSRWLVRLWTRPLVGWESIGKPAIAPEPNAALNPCSVLQCRLDDGGQILSGIFVGRRAAGSAAPAHAKDLVGALNRLAGPSYLGLRLTRLRGGGLPEQPKHERGCSRGSHDQKQEQDHESAAQ